MDLPRTLRFLKALERNNNKKWFDAHRDEYDECRAEFMKAVDELIRETSKFVPGLQGQSAKSSVFRINRDIRFSSDKTPYETAFSAVIGPEGRKSTGAIYYLHLDPGSIYVASGVYLPENYPMNQIRKHIAQNSKAFLKMVRSPAFKKNFVIDESHALKRVPPGFDPEHPAAEYLRLKSFTISHDVKKAEGDIVRHAVKYFKLMLPFNNFLTKGLQEV